MPTIKLPNGGDRLVGRDGKLVHERDANGRLVAHEFGDDYVADYNAATKDLDPRTGVRVHDGLVQRVRARPTLADALAVTRPAPTLADALGSLRRRDEVGMPTTTATLVDPESGEPCTVPTWVAALVAEALDAHAVRSSEIDAAGLPPEDEDESAPGFVVLEHPSKPGVSASVPRWAAELVQQHRLASMDSCAQAYARAMGAGR